MNGEAFKISGRDALPSVSAVVPVYNSEKTLESLVKRLKQTLISCAREHEIILVNDGSRDASWRVIEELAQANEGVLGINLLRNYGQHNALLAGIREAGHEIVVTLDDDLQNPPEEIPKLLAPLRGDFDAVYGAPERQQHDIWRNASSELTKIMLQKVMQSDAARQASAFRAFRTRLREAFSDFQSHLLSLDVLLAWGTSKFTAVTVRHEPRQVGQSNYTFRQLLRHAFTMFTGFSILPLRLASICGFIFTAFGGLVLIFVVLSYLIFDVKVQGFTFLASIIAIFSGVQLFSLGMIGEYVGRIHQRLMDKPCYVIRERSGMGHTSKT